MLATRKICGFYGTRASYGCSKCLKHFPTISASNNYSGFNRDLWTPRRFEDHIQHLDEAKAAKTQSARERIEKRIGARYSELLRLKHFDVVRNHLVDPMHNLFLGTSKKVLTLWKDHGILTDSDFENIQNQINDINPPPNIGRLPHKIAARFAGFTAEQWMLWTTVFSSFVLQPYLPHEHYSNWCLFAKACSLLCRPHVHKDSVSTADSLLLQFCQGFQDLYGEDECTPNMHMHGHLKDCILDVGPIHSFWCFSFERYNGILENMPKSWHSPEITLAEKFSSLQQLSSIQLPSEAPSELQDKFMQMKRDRTALPDSIPDVITAIEYEKNLLCRPSSLCARKQEFQIPILPAKERYLHEDKREMLTTMYAAIYGNENIVHVPLHYEEYREVEIHGTTYISAKSRSSRSSSIVAVWPSPRGVLETRTPSKEDIRIGSVNYFLLHDAIVNIPGQEEACITHLLAEMEWFQDHPQKFHFGNGIVAGAPVSEPFSSVSFMPVSHILTQCAVVNQKFQMDYGEDSLLVALPLQINHILFE